VGQATTEQTRDGSFRGWSHYPPDGWFFLGSPRLRVATARIGQSANLSARVPRPFDSVIEEAAIEPGDPGEPGEAEAWALRDLFKGRGAGVNKFKKECYRKNSSTLTLELR